MDALAGEGAVKRQRDSEDEVEDEDDDEEEEEENGDNDSDPDVPAAGSASTQTATSAKPTVSAPPVKPVLPTPAGASAAAAAAATTSAAATVGGLSTGGPAAGGLRVVRPRDSDTDDQAPDAKRQRAGDAPTVSVPVPTVSVSVPTVSVSVPTVGGWGFTVGSCSHSAVPMGCALSTALRQRQRAWVFFICNVHNCIILLFLVPQMCRINFSSKRSIETM